MQSIVFFFFCWAGGLSFFVFVSIGRKQTVSPCLLIFLCYTLLSLYTLSSGDLGLVKEQRVFFARVSFAVLSFISSILSTFQTAERVVWLLSP